MSISPSPTPHREGHRHRPTSHSSSPRQLHGRGWSRSESPSHSRGRSRLSSSRRVQQRPESGSRDSQQETPSPSPSPLVAGRKRSRSPIEDGHHLFVKAQKVSDGGGRPKASDYDDVAKEVILHATAIYRCLVSTSNAFPTPSEEGELIKSAWNRANDETLQDVPIALTPVIAKVVSPVTFYCNFDFILFNLDCSTR